MMKMSFNTALLSVEADLQVRVVPVRFQMILPIAPRAHGGATRPLAKIMSAGSGLQGNARSGNSRNLRPCVSPTSPPLDEGTSGADSGQSRRQTCRGLHPDEVAET
jgi:hypothetical protein